MVYRNWNEFQGIAQRRIAGTGRSSINPEGEITFDLDTWAAMGQPQAVKLLYQSELRTIGLRKADPDEPNAVLVRIRHARSNRVVRSRPFLQENGIEIEKTLRFPFPFVEEGVLILDLRQAFPCGRSTWKSLKKRT
jgi:hypothetical protein